MVLFLLQPSAGVVTNRLNPIKTLTTLHPGSAGKGGFLDRKNEPESEFLPEAQELGQPRRRVAHVAERLQAEPLRVGQGALKLRKGDQDVVPKVVGDRQIEAIAENRRQTGQRSRSGNVERPEGQVVALVTRVSEDFL